MLGGGGVVTTPWLASELMLQVRRYPLSPRSSQLAAGFVLPSLLLRGRWGCSGRAILHCRRLSAALLQKGGQERKGLEEGGVVAGAALWQIHPIT